LKRVFLRKKITSRIADGHPWVFANEIGDEPDQYAAGDIVSVFSYNGSFVGKGYVNPASIIKIRFLSRNEEEEIDFTYFKEKIQNAFALRQKMGDITNCRVVYSESDYLPGLIIDKFGDVLVFQTLTLGMELCKSSVISAIQAVFNTDKIFERNDNSVRKIENLPILKGFSAQAFPTLFFLENTSLQFTIDIENSPKTGFYWEQKSIEQAIRPFIKNASVLDLFCASGWCSLHALLYGAKKVIGIDQDTHAITLAKSNAELNNFSDKSEFIKGNVFDLLKSNTLKQTKFDVIILDPPSLAKSKAKIPQALLGYRELNLRAMKLLNTGGILISTCSSFLISEEMMIALFQDCAKDCGKKLRLIGKINQPADHPILWNLPSCNYFKGYVIEIA